MTLSEIAASGTGRMVPQLSKTRFQNGLQCLKRLYLECYHRELADPIDSGQQAIFDSGIAVGEVARKRFPGGRLVEETYLEHDQAVETTQDLLEDCEIPSLYEAAFTFDGIRTRVDVLKRTSEGRFDLVEVKSTTRVKQEHISDVAIQLHVVEGAGIPIGKVYLMHINREYVYPGGDHDLKQLFTLADVTEAARTFVEDNVGGSLAWMWETLSLEAAPEIGIGRHCTSPYRCSFYEYCHLNEPEDTRPLFVGQELGPALGEIRFPAAFLDFESVNPAIPLYEGTRPYQAVPFQWSMHVLESSGRLTHKEFLSDDTRDPREQFVASLLEAVLAEGSVVAYSSFETTRMRELAEALPQFREGLLDLCDRTVDLLRIIRANYYHPGFHGSYSLKSVLPALAPDLDYADLDISEGMSASISYARMIDGVTPTTERAEIRDALLEYCKRDTEAMVRVYEALRNVAGR